MFSEQVTLEQTRAAGIVQYVRYCSKCIPYSVALPQIRGFFRELEASSSVSQKTFPKQTAVHSKRLLPKVAEGLVCVHTLINTKRLFSPLGSLLTLC